MNDVSTSIKRLMDKEDAQVAYCCMGEVPTPFYSALCICRDWIAENLGKYIEAYHMHLESGVLVGHLYYALSEHALIPYKIEPGYAVLYCEWIQEKYQQQGLGKRLFGQFREDMQASKIKGILVECTDNEAQMYFKTYLARGFEVVHQSGHKQLLFLPLERSDVNIQPLEKQIQPYQKTPVEIIVVKGFMCPHDASSQFLLRQVIQEFKGSVSLQEVRLDPETLGMYGVSGGIFINGRQKFGGGETEESIRQIIMEELQIAE